MVDTLSSFGYITPLLVLILSIILHEVAHGVAAYLHGDTTAYDAGRLTLNPIPHIDVFGSIILPFLSVMFTNYAVGYAKPVPYNPSRLSGKYAEFWVASAGILTNFAVAFLAVLAFKGMVFLGLQSESLVQVLFLIVWTNISLGVFNLMPIPPFDGMSIVQSLFPSTRRLSHAALYSPLSMILILVIATSIFNAVSPYLATFIMYLLH